MTVEYIHIQTTKGGVTLAVRNYKSKPQSFEVGAAFCSPSERCFNRKKGRMIAEGRLGAESHGFVLYTKTFKSDVLRCLADSPEDVLSVLKALKTRSHGKLGLPGPLWWAGFIKEVRGRFDKRRTVKERLAGTL